MLFNSAAFAVFLPIVFLMYWFFPSKYRWILLLAASYYFYMGWNAKYVLLIFGTTLISYLCGILMDRAEHARQKKCILILSCIVILGVLFLFKYCGFFLQNLNFILGKFFIQIHPFTGKLLLPVGISFYTFQTLSYMADIYQGKQKAERHFGYYAVFISFFPQLVAGPIERAEHLLPQMKGEHAFSYAKASYGVRQMAIGYFKKIVLADTLAVYVDTVYQNVHAYSGFTLFLTSVFFSFQIYCDFSGYSDIAIGTAKLFDMDLTDNFKSPYFSISIHDFWKRWHISLSSFFRDYIYIPLGGNRCDTVRNSLNLMGTFLLSGLWHGAAWHYIVWGGVNGLLQILENFVHLERNISRKSWAWYLRAIVTFFVINFTWIFFRNGISDSCYIIRNLLCGISDFRTYFQTGIAGLGIDRYSLMTLLVFLIFLLAYDYFSLERDLLSAIAKYPVIPRWVCYTVFVVLICVFSRKGAGTEFVYFQF